MQRAMHNLHAQNPNADGVVGRIMSELTGASTPYASEIYSLMGNVKMTEGAAYAPNIVDKFDGVPRFAQLDDFKYELGNMTEHESESLFADTYSSVLESSLRQTENLGSLLEGVTIGTDFSNAGTMDQLSAQFDKVSKLIKLRDTIGTERAAFITNLGGWDTHNSFDKVAENYATVNFAIDKLVTELKAQGIWDNVTLVTVSDFGRTMTSNGWVFVGSWSVCLCFVCRCANLLLFRSLSLSLSLSLCLSLAPPLLPHHHSLGTDHAWAGNHMVMGGGLKGGKVFGKFPDKLGDDGSTNIGRGRLIPDMPWEAVWMGLSQWMGVP